MSIITIATSKGGAGKTTVAQVLLGAFAVRGFRVAAIDADFNQTLANWCETFSSYPISIRAELDETKIVPAAGELEEGHDVVVIDTAGSATQATVFAIGCADIVLVPIQASSADVIEAIKTMRLIESAAKMVRREIPAMVVFTDYQPNTNVSAHTRREVIKYGMFMLRTKLNRLVAFKEMTFTGIVPTTGTAGELVRSFVDEVGELADIPSEPIQLTS